MRYLIDAEYREARDEEQPRVTASYATRLRQELSVRNQRWARDTASLHEVTLGGVPAVLYSEDELGRHGNFLGESYDRICATPDWKCRLRKAHSSSKRALLSRDLGRKELDSSHSSDALLMNIFCCPGVLGSPKVCQLLGIEPGADAVFGYRSGVPLQNGKKDTTEIDLKLGDLLVEAKLTEHDFQRAPRRMVERYARFAEVFDVGRPECCGKSVDSYQLIRGVLAADAYPGHRFCVLCDARRPDLITRWHQVLSLVTTYELRCRMMVLTWQELATVLPVGLQMFLSAKYGIDAKSIR